MDAYQAASRKAGWHRKVQLDLPIGDLVRLMGGCPEAFGVELLRVPMILYLHCLGIHYLVVGTDFANFRLKREQWQKLEYTLNRSLMDRYLDT